MDRCVWELLANKGEDVHTVSAEAPVKAAVRLMNEHRIGAVLVVDGSGPRGLVTERDVVIQVIDRGLDATRIKVAAVMSGPLVTIDGMATVFDALKRMTHRRTRHLVVYQEGRLAGLVSMGDLAKAIVEPSERVSTISGTFSAPGFTSDDDEQASK